MAVIVPKGWLQSRSPAPASFKRLRDKAEESARVAQLNVAEADDESFVFTVLDKLARDNSDLLAEVQNLEEQLAYFSERVPAQTSAPVKDVPSDDSYLSTLEVAKLLKCTGETVRNYIKRGWLTGIQRRENAGVGYVYLVADDHKLQHWIEKRAEKC